MDGLSGVSVLGGRERWAERDASAGSAIVETLQTNEITWYLYGSAQQNVAATASIVILNDSF